MNRIGVLLWKEWRDQRALIVTFALLGPIATWAVQAVWMQGGGWHPVLGGIVLPALAALFAAVLAAEVLCADFASGAADALGRLPIAPRGLFAIKLGFVLLATPLYLGWLLAAEATRRALVDLDAALLIEQVLGAHLLALLGAMTTAAVIACAVLLRRGFPSVLAGILLVLGTLALIAPANHGRGPRWIQAQMNAFGVYPVVATVCLALLCTAAFGYSPWRRTRDIRRMLLATAGFGLVAVPAFAIGAVDYNSRVRMQPGDPVDVLFVAPSPDGRFVAMQVMRSVPWSTERGYADALRTVWILHVKTREIRVLPSGSQLYTPVAAASDSAWTHDGRLVCLPWQDGGEARIAWIDPDSGAVVRSRALEDYAEVKQELVPPGWCEVGAGELNSEGTRVFTLRWTARRQERTLTCARRPRPTHTPGVFLYVDVAGALVRSEWGANERVLAGGAAQPAWVRMSPDGTLAVFRRNGQDTLVLDVDTGESVLEPGPWRLLDWRSRGVCTGVFSSDVAGRFALVQPAGARELEIEGMTVHGLCPTPSGEFLALRSGHGFDRLDRLDEDGHVLDILYEGPRLETR